MNVFQISEKIRREYGEFVKGYLPITDPHIREFVEKELDAGVFWPPPLIQINPAYAPGATLKDLVLKHGMDERVLDAFRQTPESPVPLYRHQQEAIELALQGRPFLITTGTGSGKTWSYLIPILNHILQDGAKPDTPYAVLVYPMNALVNSQLEELRRLKQNYEQIHGEGTFPVRFARFTGQEDADAKADIRNHPPHILLTNYVMMELLLLRHEDRNLRRSLARSARFYVMDEIHTYRGRQGADVALMNRRFLSLFDGEKPLCIGASATMVSPERRAEERREAVAQYATQFFGMPFEPSQIVEESLQRRTEDRKVEAHELREMLHAPLKETLKTLGIPEEWKTHPLNIWLENTFGVRKDPDGRLRRQIPRRLEDGVVRFLRDAGVEDTPEHRKQIRELLEQAFIQGAREDRFSFKLHLFFSQGGDLRATLERPPRLSVHPVNRLGDERAYPLKFCRHCGQHFYAGVYSTRTHRFLPMEVEESETEEDLSQNGEEIPDAREGYLMLGQVEGSLEDWLPEEWLKKKNNQKIRQRWPEVGWWVRKDGKIQFDPPEEGEEALPAIFIPAPFSICPSCGVYYTGREKDYRKLAELSTEGRALATTIHLLSVLPELRSDVQDVQKVLSFTDNRQDAAFQAGFFNDFVQTLLVRSALHRALQKYHQLEASQLASAVLEVLKGAGLRLQHIVKPSRERLEEGTRAAERVWERLRLALEILLYADMGREWRVLYPNLEQTGQLRIVYRDLDEFLARGDVQQAFSHLPEDRRRRWIKAFLDHLRMNRVVDMPWMSRGRYQGTDTLRNNLTTSLHEFWVPAEEQVRERWAGFSARTNRKRSARLSVSATSVFGQWTRRMTGWDRQTYEQEMKKLVDLLLRAGILEGDEETFRLHSDQLLWLKGTGKPEYENVYLKRTGDEASTFRINKFFQTLYEKPLEHWMGLRAAEHTAQVSYERRIEREEAFRRGTLPVIFCSPTMELGIDIRDLLVVHMRNVPPTPANYAQRSGRAGRKGEPALILTYCGQNSHDQYFFDRQTEMVSGEVRTPWIDFDNQDLLRTHIHSIWFSELGVKLGNSIKEHLIDLKPPELPLQESLKQAIETVAERKDQILPRIQWTLDSLWQIQPSPSWYSPAWVEEMFDLAPAALDQALNRWRELYQYAKGLSEQANQIVFGEGEIEEGNRLTRQATRLINVLYNTSSKDHRGTESSDYHPYRYLASEGFLPAYAFPRRPVRALLFSGDREEVIQRHRSIAIHEYAPLRFLYHEGGRYVIRRALLLERQIQTALRRMQYCAECGYFADEHMDRSHFPLDHCPLCGQTLSLVPILHMPHVGAYRRRRITSDEAARIREGICLSVLYRHEEVAKHEIRMGKDVLGTATFAPKATLRLLNQGYLLYGCREFYVLPRTGEFFLKADSERLKSREEDRQALRQTNLYVDLPTDVLVVDLEASRVPSDGRNAFLVSFAQAMLVGLSHHFELEERELGHTVYPERNRILFYEAVAGGLSVLRRLAEDDGKVLRAVAAAALEHLHFDPESLENRKEECTAACYGCLMTYQNQRFHGQLNRFLVHDVLKQLMMEGSVRQIQSPSASEEDASRLDQLLSRTDSELERKFLRTLYRLGGRLPDVAQYQVPGLFVEADFYYEDSRTCVFVDGPHHDRPEQQREDREKRLQLREKGYRVVVIRYDQDMEEAIRRYGDVFGVRGT